MAHRVFILFLMLTGVTAFVAVGVNGLDYYATPVSERAFRDDYASMKPSGLHSHTLGILGAGMVTIGVAMYSSRKRIRALWPLGKLSSWLEVHIFLCLLGPVLVMYHTTFKAGGIAAICLWSMLSVAASGIVGRFLYVLIPRNLKGSELSAQQINEEFDRVSAALRGSEIGMQLMRIIDQRFASIGRPSTLFETVRIYIRLINIKREVKRTAKRLLAGSGTSRQAGRTLYKAAAARASLIQRSVILLQVEKLFYYWHAIHLPFTIMMFLTLAVHVGVAVWLGYHWIF
jgi:hypothetical protein